MLLSFCVSAFLHFVLMGTFSKIHERSFLFLSRYWTLSVILFAAVFFSLGVWTCLGVNPLDMPRTSFRASEGETLWTNPSCLITQPLRHHLYVIHQISSMDVLHCFYRFNLLCHSNDISAEKWHKSIIYYYLFRVVLRVMAILCTWGYGKVYMLLYTSWLDADT